MAKNRKVLSGFNARQDGGLVGLARDLRDVAQARWWTADLASALRRE